MKITSIHICQYNLEDLYDLVDKDLAAQGLTRTEKPPVMTNPNGKETWTFEATSLTPTPRPVKIAPKGKGGRPKKILPVVGPVVAPVQETEVVAPSARPFHSHPPSKLRLHQVG